MNRCRWCGKPIRWAKTTSGKSIPLDLHTNPDGNIELINGVAHVVGQSDRPGDVRHMPHHATCTSPFNPSNQRRK